VRRSWTIITLLAAVTLVAPGASSAATTATPIPGGANQAIGISGKLGATLFNGKIRVRHSSLRAGTSSDGLTGGSGDKVIYFSCLVSNATNSTRVGYLTAKLADADGVVLNSSSGPLESDYELPPGGVARQTFGFVLKNGYTPAKVFLSEDANGVQPVFRVNLTPKDIPT
jgi:hypothetical protein